MNNEPHKCSERMFHDYHYHNCKRSGTVFENRKWWCKQHAPSAVEARKKARTEKFDAKWAAWEQAEAAAERDRLKLDLFGELVECLRYAYGFVGDDEDTTRPETKAEVFEQCKRIRAVLDKAAAIEGRTRA